jgi:5-formyltetrahydrofolate cyclo-ligase
VSDFTRDAERLRSAKVALRSQLLTARRSLPEAVRRAADRSVQASTVAWLRAAKPTVCAAYVPVGTEPGGPDLPEILAGARTVLLPVLLPDGDLDWAPHHGTVRRTARGLLEPTGRTLGMSAIGQADVIIVPAVAVSRTGTRLGRGGGSYDRALARAPSAFVIALLHDGELLDDVPAEPHDHPVNAVVTPTDGLVVLNPR